MQEKVLIFGLGEIFKEFIVQESKKYDIVGFSDNDQEKIGKTILEKKVIHPKDIPKTKFDVVIITSSYFNEIRLELINLGIPKEKIRNYSITDVNDDVEVRKQALKRMERICKERPLDINIETFSFCPMKCTFCCNRIFERKKSIMDNILFEKIVKEYVELFGGGTLSIGAMQSDFLSDPLLFNRLKVIEKYKTKIYLYSTTPLVSLAKYTDIEVIQILKLFDYLQISVEGYNQDTYYNMSGINGFRTLREQLIRIKRIIDQNSIPIKIELYFRVQDVFETINSEFFQMCKKMFTISDIKTDFFSWFGSIKENDIPVGAKLYKKDNTKNTEDCVVPHSSLSVQATGNVVGCGCIDWLEQNIIGNCNEQSLDEIWHGEKNRSFQQSFSKRNIPKICKECGLYIEMKEAFSNSHLISYESIKGVYYKQ